MKREFDTEDILDGLVSLVCDALVALEDEDYTAAYAHLTVAANRVYMVGQILHRKETANG